MAHEAQRIFCQWVKDKFTSHFSGTKVLEVGSLDVNGTVRTLFVDCEYLGLDVGEGPGVDLVCSGHEHAAPDNTYDVCVSTECFEHNQHWLETFKVMVRVCRPGGLVFFTCATTGRAEHGTAATSPGDSPLTCALGWDYYKNLTEDDFAEDLDFSELFEEYQFLVEEDHKDLQFWGVVR